MPAPLRIELLGYAFEMIPIEGGTFRMGSPKGAEDAFDDEYPEHDVIVPDFCLGRYPVTQALWRAVALAAPEFGLEPEPSNFKGEERPVENVSLNEIREKFLPAINKLTDSSFRSPTQEEWKYAVRGGKYHAETYAYAGSDKLREVGWYDDNSGKETQPVGLLYPNALGLYDMSGNVWEWCEDDWQRNYKDSPGDGTAWVDEPKEDISRFMRGGKRWNVPRGCFIASRFGGGPAYCYLNLGFRLASTF